MQAQGVVGTSPAMKAVPWLTACVGQLNVSPEVLAASVGPGGLLASQHEGLLQGLEHLSAFFATGGVICLVPRESSNLPMTDRCRALLPFLLGEGGLAAGEVSWQYLLGF